MAINHDGDGDDDEDEGREASLPERTSRDDSSSSSEDLEEDNDNDDTCDDVDNDNHQQQHAQTATDGPATTQFVVGAHLDLRKSNNGNKATTAQDLFERMVSEWSNHWKKISGHCTWRDDK